MDARFNKNAELHRNYTKFMREYENLGHMVEVTGQIDETTEHYHIPHHAVGGEDGKSFRVVFNASYPTESGV